MKSVTHLNLTPVGNVFPSPVDWRDTVLYSLLVDRFDDGSSNGRKPGTNRSRGHCPDSRMLFQGGTLKGIIRRLEYIAGLGANALWLSPIFKNRPEMDDSYHGYGVHDFLDVDPRFGTIDDFRELVSCAHALGMYVILDIVTSYTGDNWAYEADRFCEYSPEGGGPHPFGFWRTIAPGGNGTGNDAVWPMEFQHQECYLRRGKIRDWKVDGPEALEGDFDTLKKLDLQHPTVLRSLIKIYQYWISATDVDGFRLDAAKHMDPGSVASFCSAVREHAKNIGKHNFLIFGEIAAGYETIKKYLKGCAFCEGNGNGNYGIDAALDFPLSYILERVVKGFSNPEELRRVYNGTNPLYANGRDAGINSVTFLDNHDRNQRFLHQNPYHDQVVLALGYLLTSLGVPSIYYGTEQGFDGGGPDLHYVRESMFLGNGGSLEASGTSFFDVTHPIYRNIANLTSIRRAEPALRYGRQYFRETSTDGRDFIHPADRRCTLAYSRLFNQTELVVALNLDFHSRNDFITIDFDLHADGEEMVDLLNPATRVHIYEQDGRNVIQPNIDRLGMAIFKKC